MLEPNSVNAGDELVESYGNYGSQRIVKVAKVTPSGQIVLDDGRRYRNDGREIGGDKWHSNMLSPLTPGLRNEITKKAQRLSNIAMLRGIRWDDVSSEKLNQIVIILRKKDEEDICERG